MSAQIQNLETMVAAGAHYRARAAFQLHCVTSVLPESNRLIQTGA
jgi:hypothetical protein